MSGMRRMLLSCEQATYLAAKEEAGNISDAEKRRLKMHMAICNPCKRYYHQSLALSQNIRDYVKKVKDSPPVHRLSNSDKSKLEHMIHERLKGY